jgi:hypothetical protein
LQHTDGIQIFDQLTYPQRVSIALRWVTLQRGPTASELESDVALYEHIVINQLSAGLIADRMLNSLEFFAKHGLPPDWAWLNWCFTHALGRIASPDVVNSYAKSVREHPQTRGELLLGITGTDEFSRYNRNALQVLAMYVALVKDHPAAETDVRHWADAIKAGAKVASVASQLQVSVSA